MLITINISQTYFTVVLMINLIIMNPAAFRRTSYELLDFGQKMRLERFGDFVVSRYCGASLGDKTLSEKDWSLAHFSYERMESHVKYGKWSSRLQFPSEIPWTVEFDKLHFNLDMHDMGQVGVFPEQYANWQWLSKVVLNEQRPLKILNCFAYTGGSTMACASVPSSQITHLDASKPSTTIAKNNLKGAKLVAPVRWIVDDVSTFLHREIKRENKYHGIILDPPAFGKFGSKEWVLQRDLEKTVELLPNLLVDDPSFVLLTCHDIQWTSIRLATLLESALKSVCTKGRIHHGPMILKSSNSEKHLKLGSYVRWQHKIS